METAKELRSEYVVSVSGLVNKRPEKNVQADRINGDIELEILGIEVLNAAEPSPLDITGDTIGIDEAVRLKYRYLDLRTPAYAAHDTHARQNSRVLPRLHARA